MAMVSDGADLDVLSFVQELGRRRVRFRLEGGKLTSAGSEEPTPAEAGFIRRNKAEIIAHLLSQSAEIGRAGAGDAAVAPLSYQQERLWLLDEIAEHSEEYNSVTAVRVRGDLDRERLCEALRRVVAENDVLRTVYRMAGDTTGQIVLDTDLPIWREEADTADDALAKAQSLQLAESGHRFDLSREIPVRCRLITGPGVSYVILNIHHIVCDGWSMPIVWQQLRRFYDTPDASPADPGCSYADYARWQRQVLTGDILDTMADRWRERLDGAPLVHGMPVDGSRDAPSQIAGVLVRQPVAASTYDAFVKNCVAAGANEFAGLHAALAILVAIVSGREETIIGSPIANRELPDIQDTIGFFVNMIAVRSAVRPSSTFGDVLDAELAEIEFGYAFQQVPFERVVQEVIDERTDRSPIFQIVLALQNFGAGGPSLPGVDVDVLPDVQQRSRFDLEVFVSVDGGRNREILWVYDGSLFEQETVERWAGWLARIIAVASGGLGVSVADLRTSLTGGVVRTDHPETAGEIDVLERIEAVAAEDPGRIAVSEAVRHLTYGELARRASEIGAALTGKYGPGGVYALEMPQSIELVQTIAAVLSIGGSYLVVDPEDGAARRAAVLEACRPRCLLTAGAHVPADLDVIDVRALEADSRGPRVPASGDADLYYVFTSGSTGRPKGVRVTYGNLRAYLGGVVGRLRLPAGARYCWQSSVTTDFGNTVLFGALATGGRLDIAARDDILDGAAMRSFLRRHDTDILKITPSHMAALLETHPVTELLPGKILVLGGEAASPAVIRALRDVPDSVAVYNHYGPSETTVGVFVADVNDPPDTRALPIGRPLPAVGYAIETADGAPAPFGTAGELVIRGAQVAAGYLGERTGGFFAGAGGRGYRTGDWVRQRNDGQLVFLGRRDSQVKVRGYRVELGEVKDVLETADGVGRAAVLLIDDVRGERGMVAFVQPDGSAPVSPEIDADAVVDQWREVYDFAYAERVTGDVEFNVSGWISSYSGEKLPEDQMRHWLSSTLERISAIKPKNVLEIGCGLGVIAYPLSRLVDNYLACDFSSQIIAVNTENAKKIDTGRLSFFTCEAIDIDQHVDRVRAAGVDTVVINSVVQYFPSLDYLEAVLDKILAVESVRTVFIGDIRNYDLLDEFSLSIVDFRVPAGAAPSDLGRLQAMRAHSDQVAELLVSDEYWSTFTAQRDSVAGVSVLPRVGPVSNELFDFRYDVILTKDPDRLHRPEPSDSVEVRHDEFDEFDEFCRALAGGEVGTAVVRGIRNPWTAGHCDRLRMAKGGMTAGTAATRPAEPDPDLDRLRTIAAAHRLRTSAHYARDDSGSVSRLDVVIFRAGPADYADSAVVVARPNWRSTPLASTPTASKQDDKLATRVAVAATKALPKHMRPDRIIVVPTFPLGRTGKLDHNALRSLAARQEAAGALGELVGKTEARLAGILRELLGATVRIDRESDFFAIGGHSLLAARYAHAVNRAFGRELRAKAVFDRPRLRDFAEFVESSRDSASQPVVSGGIPADRMPISPLQQRFWTIAKASGPSTLYNTTLLLELTGSLVVAALRAAFDQVVAHHGVLRSHFREEDGIVYLRLRDDMDFALPQMEIPGLTRERAERILMERINRPFELETGPLIEAALVTASPDTHFLMMCIHHIIADGVSDAIFIEDLRNCYEAILQGREPHWRDDGATFLRYLAETEWPGNESLEFWARQLVDAPVQHSLPLDGERSAGTTHEGKSLRSALPEETTDALIDLAQRHGTTLFVVFNALAGLFFSFLSGEDDVVIGAPFDCRETEADNTAMGMYLNTVPIRHRIDWTKSFDSLIAKEWAFFRDAFAHRHVPFDRVVEHVNPVRIPGMNPVFQILLALQPEGPSKFPFHDCLAHPIKASTVQSKFDLLLNSRVTDGRLVIFWEYDRSLFSAHRIEGMAKLFESFVEITVGNSSVPLGELRFGTDTDGRQSLAVLSGPVVPLADQSYLDAFARSVATRPDHPAVRDTDGTAVGYRVLDSRSDALASILYGKGVRQGDLVAVCLRRSTEFLVTVLAVNKLGAAYVPMDSEYLRLNAPALLAEHHIAFAVAEDDDPLANGGDVVVVRRRELPETAASSTWPRVAIGHTDLCYVIFTSGSTGRPKGVAVSHVAVVNYLTHCAATYLDRQPQVAVVASPQSFDATVTTTLFALAAGLTLQLVAEGNEIAGLRHILAQQPDERLLLKLTPSHLVALSNLGVTRQASAARHVFVIGGEDLSSAVVAPWFRTFGESLFFNEYGPTEATVGCIVHQVDEQDVRRGLVPIGTPICNTAIAAVHREMICVPYQRGEIVITGTSLARGYLDSGRPEGGFRAVPALGGAIGYYTGDVALLTESGFRYHGRSNDDIKIRGFRISLAEVEAAIGGVDKVAACACAVSADGRRLCAYIVPAAAVSQTQEDEAELRTTLRRTLPSYMVPEVITLIDELPLTANGKVDVRKLTTSHKAPIELDTGTRPSDVLGRLTAIWQHVLGASRELPTDSSFFSLGGNSLLVTWLLMRVNEEFEASITLDMLYRHVTLSEQCALITSDAAAVPEPDVAPSAANDPAEAKMTDAQRRFLFLEKLGTGADHAISLCFHIEAGIDIDHLRSAVVAVLDRHPILKSQVSELSGFPVPVPGEAIASSECVEVVRCTDGEDSLTRILSRRDSAVNVFSGPLSRTFIHRLPDGSADLQIAVHHIVFDGWSETIILTDLARLYTEIVATGKAEPGSTVPFWHYAAEVSSENAKANTEWWIETLAGVSGAHGLPRTERECAAGEPARVVHRVVEGEILNRLDDTCQRLGVTQFNVIHSVLALAVCTVSSETEVVVGVPVANRLDAIYRDTVGLFMETLPMRTTIGGGDATFAEILRDNHLRISDALTRTDFRVEEVMNARASHPDSGGRALYEVMLSYHDEGGSALDFAGVPAKRILLPTREPKLDLIVDVKMVEGRLHIYWEYDTSVLSYATVHELVEQFGRWLAWGLRRPDEPVRARDISWVPDREEGQDTTHDSRGE
ncbi:condensation domain-containing protein [Actinophytocola glycyrrhizae]|uniref:Condensation domain-containing protein n=1 Tax=Actinophytocola glycyrrhizae TaxID=2044873 RepID=A0ABV9RSQ5_9PSEU